MIFNGFLTYQQIDRIDWNVMQNVRVTKFGIRYTVANRSQALDLKIENAKADLAVMRAACGISDFKVGTVD